MNTQVQQQQQAAAAHLGSKAIGAGSHGVKTNQISLANPGMKVGQAVSGVGGMLKTKSKRERSVSIDSGETRNAIPAAVLEADAKGEGVMRSKRRCVLEKKQPYSGDEWCSGPDTEEDEDKPHTAAHRERGLAGPIQALQDRVSAGSLSEPGGPVMSCGVGPGLKTEPTQPSQQVVYVFTTSLANSAAEAVMKGQSDSILLFHQQNVQHSKLEQGHSSGKLSSKLSEKVSSSCSPPKSQSGTPRPASAGVGPLHPAGTPSSATHSDNENSQTRPGGSSSKNSLVTHRSDGGSAATPAGPDPASGDRDGAGAVPVTTVSPSGSPSILSAHLQSDAVQRCGSGNTDGLSKEQLEHRERSLQTLRDIERLLLRSGAGGGPGDPGGPTNNAPNNSSNLNNNNSDRSAILEDIDTGTNNSGNCSSGNILSGLAPMGGMKKYEEPLQSIISQTQSLGGPVLDSPQIDSHHNLPQHPHNQLTSPGDDMGPLLGPEGLTPEQIAWRKLQEEYYQEKRRQQEIQPSAHPQHFRMMTEMGMHTGPMMVRGPPPPYHSRPAGQQWGPAGMMGGGMGSNERMIDMHQEGPRGPRFQRGQPVGGGFPGSPGGVLSIEGLGPQRPNRPGMIWLEDMPNNISGGGPFHGCYPGGPNQHVQGDPEHLLTREEIFRIMEKRHMQGVSRFELDRLAKQQQQGTLGSRLMDNLGGPDFPNLGMGRGPPTSRGEPIDFPVSREIMGSPVGAQHIRDLVDSSLGSSLAMNMNSPMNVQQQQQMILSQKLRGGPAAGGSLAEIFGSGEISRIRTSQNGRGGKTGMIPGPDGPFHFSNQGPFSGGQIDGPYLHQPGPEMFGSDQQGLNQMGGAPRLSHMPMSGGLRGADLGPRHVSDLSVNVNPMTSPLVPPPHQLKSPSLNQEPSPLLPSPSAAGLKSPTQISSAGHHPPPPPASGAATPSSLKSPQIMGSANLGLHSPSASPGRLKSPAMGSPGWTSPKTALPSPGGPPSGKAVGNGGSSSTETGQSLPPRSSNSTPISQPGSMNPSMPFTSSPDAPPSQNPLSLIMSQMSKYAMPSSTPLYHDAIKTIATSDDEMIPDRPLLSAVSIAGNMVSQQTSQMLVSHGSMGPHSDPQSPMGIVSQGQQQHLSHDTSGSVLSSPNQMGMPAMNSAMMGGDGPEGMGPCNVSPQNQMSGFPRMQPPSHGPMHSPIGGMSQNFPQSNEEILPHQQLHMMSKGHPHQRPHHPSDSFPSLPMGDGPDLSEVIRPTHTGIPEFDLSRIIPSDKPSSTLQYFPKSEPHQNPHQGPPSQHHTPQQLLKQLSSSGSSSGLSHGGGPSSNPHLASLQNMMAEQQLPPHTSHGVIRQTMGIPQGGSRGMVSGGGMGPMCPPGHMMGRTGLVPQQQLQQQQVMMNNSLLHHPSNPYPGMIPSQQHPHNLMAQQNLMMMQAKQRSLSIPGEPFGPQGPLMSPQGPMMGPSHPQSGMMGPQSLRQRGMSLDSPIGYGPGGMTNMPF